MNFRQEKRGLFIFEYAPYLLHNYAIIKDQTKATF